jgi:hypothetical protein
MRNKKISADAIKSDWKQPGRLVRLWWKATDIDLVPNKIKYKYWELISYDWRPFQIWYRLKCFLWKRYTTVKPRYLGHTWCDRVATLPHTMFEILSDFIEKECVGGPVAWYHEDSHKVVVNGVERFRMDEMLALYNWWHLKYNKAYKEIEEDWWKKVQALEVKDEWPEEEFEGEKVYRWEKKFKSEEHERLYNFYLDRMHDLDYRVSEELDLMLHRLINVRQSLWT